MIDDEPKYCVYIHTFPNKKKYVGITSTNVLDRWGKNGNGYKSQQLMKRAIDKYGWDNIKHEIVMHNLTEEEACKVEIALIKELNTTDHNYGYNALEGGNATPRYYGKKVICLNNLKIYNSAVEASKATGAEHSKICATCRGKRHSSGVDPITKEPLMWEFYDPNKTYTKQTYPDEYKVIKKPVLCIETGKIYECTREASIDLEIDKHSIYGSCRTGVSSSGYHFKYV